MRSSGRGKRATRVAMVSSALALAGCVPGAYLYEDAPGAYYGGTGAHYAPPAYYYGSPGYQYYPPYPPRVVYVDHDHRGEDCRDESHRHDGDHNDRNDQRHHRGPPGGAQVVPPATPPTKREARANGSGPPASPPGQRDSRRQSAPRVRDGDEPVRRSEERKDLD